MKYFGSVVLVCIFQSIRLSFACYGYSMELMELQSGPENRIKFENDPHFELTDDCDIIANCHMTIDKPYTSALISAKTKNSFMDIFTVKNVDFCTFVSDYHVTGLKCSSAETGRVRMEFKGEGILSEYGPFLGFIAGNLTILVKVCYDGDDHNPDIFAGAFTIKMKESSTPLWLDGSF